MNIDFRTCLRKSSMVSSLLYDSCRDITLNQVFSLLDPHHCALQAECIRRLIKDTGRLFILGVARWLLVIHSAPARWGWRWGYPLADVQTVFSNEGVESAVR